MPKGTIPGIDSFLVDISVRGMLVFDSEGTAVRINAKANQIISSLAGNALVLSETDLLEIFRLDILPLDQTQDSRELTVNGKVLLVNRQKFEIRSNPYISYFIQDISGEKTLVGTIHRQTSESLWKIRSCITSVQSALAILVDYQSEELSEQTFDLLVDSRFEIWKLSRYIDNLRDLSLLNANIIEKQLDIENVEIKQLISIAINNINSFKTNIGKRFVLTDSTPENIAIQCDKNRCVRIMEAILINSIFYSKNDTQVTISVQESGSDDEITLHFKDNGIGIPQEDQALIFEYGFRAGNVKEQDSSGMGLELHLSRQIMNRMNASIAFVSKENEGSVFALSFRKGHIDKKQISSI